MAGIYVHVPYCASRCGYCDFNTYVAPEAERAGFAALACAEIALAARTFAGPVETVFFGGGTPTLLPPGDLIAILDAVRREIGLVAGAEITTEANPDSVDAQAFAELRDAGFTRISFGMQSAVEHVLRTLDRRHTPGRAAEAASEARAAGFEHVSLDLIYGTPGESDDDWRVSLEAVAAARPDHASAYPLTVERGTKLHARVRRGELPEPDPGVQGRRYAMADAAFEAVGLRWYELFNWARGGRPEHQCRHNLGYWRSADWWGIGPGAHSHVAGVRWWNHKRPGEYARLLGEGRSPEAGREVLTPDAVRMERAMLEVRLAAGVERRLATRPGTVDALEREGLLAPCAPTRSALTLRGRRHADRVVRALTG